MAEAVAAASQGPKKAKDLADWFDEISVRFIINLPEQDLTQPARLGFSIEEAHWFYEDFIRPISAIESPSHQPLPSLNLKRFITLLFSHCPLLTAYAAHADSFYESFMEYKGRVPVRGLILLDDSMEKVLLVKGFKKGAKWSFPRGKIARDEDDLTCAVREVYEETGYDARDAGLLPDGNNGEAKSFEHSVRDQDLKMFVIRGVPLGTHFAPRTRKEISKIQWWNLADLPTMKRARQYEQQQLQLHQGGIVGAPVIDPEFRPSNFYMVAPFIGPLKHWIKLERRKDRAKERAKHPRQVIIEDEETETGGEDLIPEPDPTDVEDREEDEDLKRLLARLQHSKAPRASSASPPEVAPQTQSTDSATALKGLLGLASPTTAPEVVETPQDQNPLLAILRGTTNQPPQTPSNQVQHAPPKAATPHHYHPHAPESFAGFGPPPPFPLPPTHVPLHPSHVTQPHPQQRQLATGDAHIEALQHREVVPEHRPPVPPYEQPLRQPLHAGNHHLHPYLPQFPEVHALSVPEANKLPLPKLTGDTLALLNAFKSPATQAPPLLASIARPIDAASGPEKVSPESLVSSASRDAPPVPQQSKPKPRSQQQDLLLTLFRTSAAGGSSSPEVRPGPATSTRRAANEPVELSAHPSTPYINQPSSGQHQASARQLSGASSGPAPVQPSLALDTSGLRPRSPGLTSATVSGPLNAPDFEAMKRGQKISPVELGPGSAPSSAIAERPTSGKFKPTEILQRPLSSGQRAQKGSDSDVAVSASPKGHRRSQRKLKGMSQLTEKGSRFQPQLQPGGVQILKRPSSSQLRSERISPQLNVAPEARPEQVVTSPQESPLPLHPSSATDLDEQKSALLALFGAPSKHAAPPPITQKAEHPPPQQPRLSATPDAYLTSLISPVSPLPAAQAHSHSLGPGLNRNRESRMSSLVSALESMSESRKESLAVQGGFNTEMGLRVSGISSPHSPKAPVAPVAFNLTQEPASYAYAANPAATGVSANRVERAVGALAPNNMDEGTNVGGPKLTPFSGGNSSGSTTAPAAAPAAPTDKDRDFLLGYLRGVARSG